MQTSAPHVILKLRGCEPKQTPFLYNSTQLAVLCPWKPENRTAQLGCAATAHFINEVPGLQMSRLPKVVQVLRAGSL